MKEPTYEMKYHAECPRAIRNAAPRAATKETYGAGRYRETDLHTDHPHETRTHGEHGDNEWITEYDPRAGKGETGRIYRIRGDEKEIKALYAEEAETYDCKIEYT